MKCSELYKILTKDG